MVNAKLETHYDEVPLDTVAAEKRKTAESACTASCVDLELASVTIRWFRKTNPRLARMEELIAKLADRSSTAWMSDWPICGQASNLHDRHIWVNAELDIDETVRTVRHELRHLWQYKHWGLWVTDHEHERCEADARAYE